MDQCDAAVVQDLAAVAVEVREVHGVPTVMMPGGWQLKELEHLMPSPIRVKQRLKLASLEAAIRYINRFKDDGSVVLMKRNGSFEAVLDYHEPPEEVDGNGARWGQHVALFEPVYSDRWLVWMGAHKRAMSQRDFAEFVEDNASDFLAPTGGAMLDIARTLEAKQNVNFKSGIRLENGDVSLVFEETTVAKAGQMGDLPIPSEFTIGVPVLLGEPARPVAVRLKYAVKEGAVTFSVEILRLAALLEGVTREIYATVKNETGIEPLLVA